jgi:GNAT superfamily N-acetyltransferase
MIRKLKSNEFDAMLHVINDAAEAYRCVIPEDRWKEPYLSTEELRNEVKSGVQFYGRVEENNIVAVMGMQYVKDLTLIRHAYVLRHLQRKGIGQDLLRYLLRLSNTPQVLVGTWKAAWWAIRFYEKNGFVLESETEKNRLLREYWAIPERQIETSVVLSLDRRMTRST